MANPRTLVLDVGKTNVKLLVMSKAGEILDEARRENVSIDAAPYLHIDVDGIWAWMLETMAQFAKSHDINVIVPTTHGSTAALVAGRELLLPIADYEAAIPPEFVDAFKAVSPPFSETFSPDLPAGLNLGRQLFWLQNAHGDAFARAEWALTYPQYWSWMLSGVPASETTSLGCHSHLWNPLEDRFSSLVESQGWAGLFPPRKAAHDVLGPISKEVQQATGLSSDCQVLCGIHDGNAAFSLYLRGLERPFSLLSTGTWVVAMSPRLPLNKLNANRDTLAIVDINGNPLPVGRFMGGREFEILTEGAESKDFTEQDLASVIAKRSFLLPSFAPAGPFMGRTGESRGPDPASSGEIVARATLYLALMTETSMRMLGMDGDLMIDGGFAGNTPYCRLLATLGDSEKCFVNHQTEGTAVGAGMLASWNDAETRWPLDPSPVAALDLPGLAEYTDQWRRQVDPSD